MTLDPPESSPVESLTDRLARREQKRRAQAENVRAQSGLEDLSLPWAMWADGRPHRLKRGKHYKGSARAVQEEAQHAAWIMGKGLQTMREQLGKYEYFWFQFADHELATGEPCHCGGKELLRIHPGFVRCTSCGKTSAVR